MKGGLQRWNRTRHTTPHTPPRDAGQTQRDAARRGPVPRAVLVEPRPVGAGRCLLGHVRRPRRLHTPGGHGWISPLFGIAVFAYGGVPFLKGAAHEIRVRQPGMMLLIGLAITVAFTASLATSLQ